MNDLISMGGVCFVARPPRTGGLGGLSGRGGRSGRADGNGIADCPEAGTGKRKYRPRGERSRKEQYRAASRSYRLRHQEQCRAWQAKYRQEHREELREYHRKYYAEKRAHILNLHRAAYRKRRKGKR